MFDAAAPDAFPTPVGQGSGDVQPLSKAARGWCGTVARVGGSAGELERRLLEIGFVEGARLHVLHEGLFGRDPMAVMVDDTRVALRRREAADILVRFDPARRGASGRIGA